MIKISPDQLEEFESMRWGDYIDSLVISARQRFPSHVGPLTDEQLFKAIEAVALKADALGFKFDDEIEDVVDHSIVFGAQFDSDPCMAWAGEILRDPAFASPDEKLDFLDNDINLYSRDIFDDDSMSIPIAAFERFAELLNDQFFDAGGEGDTVALLRTIWPQKAAACESTHLTAFVRAELELAAHHGFVEPRCQSRFALIGFMLGHRFDTDPFFARAAHALNVIGPEQEMRLYQIEQTILSDVVTPRLIWARENAGV